MFKLSMLRVNVTRAQDQLVTYVNSAARVSLYATGVIQNNVPALTSPPPDYYQNFAERFSAIKTTALTWPNGIEAQMMALPRSIINFNALFTQQAKIILGLTQQLQADPTSPTLQADLANSLKKLEGNVRAQLGAATQLLAIQKDFATGFTGDAATLVTLAKAALDAASPAGRTAIARINEGINNIQAQLDALSRWVDAIHAAEITSLVFECVGILVKLIPEGGEEAGEVIEKIAEMAHDASEAEEIAANAMIASTNKEIQADRQELALFEQDIALLNGLNSQCQQLLAANQAAQAAIANVEAIWNELVQDMNEAIDDLGKIGSDATSKDFQQAEADINAAIADWKKAEDFATAIVNIQFVHPGTVINIPPAGTT